MQNAFDLDDGTSEVVSVKPERQRREVAKVRDVAGGRSGGHMARMNIASDRGRREFVLIRTQTGVAKMALSHIPTYRALVRAWMAKRAMRAVDPGVSLAEIAEAAGVDPEACTSHVRSLAKNGAIRIKTTCVGWQGTRSAYYPTEAGALALSIAETLGEGAMVKTGRPANAWKARNVSEPPNVFHFVALGRRETATEMPKNARRRKSA